MSKLELDLLLQSNHIFDGTGKKAFQGYIGISGNKIAVLGTGAPEPHLVSGAKRVLDLKDQVICPGFVDVHTFFTGYAIFHVGFDAGAVTSQEECCNAVAEYAKTLDSDRIVFGHGWKPDGVDLSGMEAILNEQYPDRAVIIFSENRDTCIMNAYAGKKYGFCPDTCYPESYYKIMKEYLNDTAFIQKEWDSYQELLAGRGITSVKEMGFDDYYGFTDFLKKQDEGKNLTMRVAFMSQPNGEPVNIPYGKEMRETFAGEFVRFSGYNRMVDGTIASGKADLLEPYEGTRIHCHQEINYEQIKEEVLLADRNGFRYSLHAQGDGAVHKILEIYEQCEREHGRCINRHAITDMEFTSPGDLEKMGTLGVIAEIYPQIMSLDPGEVVQKHIKDRLGSQRSQYYWNRRKMQDSGVAVSCATDLPLMISNIPESIYHSCGGFFPEGGEPFQSQNTVTKEELLKAWTFGGQYNLGVEDTLGTLEVGKLADIAVLNKNVFGIPMEQMRETQVSLTICDGKIVYEKMASEPFI